MVFVTSDPHGHKAQLVAGLQAAGLLDDAQAWAGGEQQLWVLGDLLDRGPDGVGVIDLVRRLQIEAESAGGHVGALLGNHEVLALGMLQFGSAGSSPSADQRLTSVALTWARNGGRESDQEGLTGDRLEWVRTLPALHIEGDFLLMHADTVEYLSYATGPAASANPGGAATASVEDINAAVTADLLSTDVEDWQRLWHRLTTRFDFASADGAAAVRRVAAAFGIQRLVHGHSIISEFLDITADRVTAPLLYADNKVLAIDGGIYAGGPCLVVDLDAWP